MRFDGMIALVTGAGSGIGRALAVELACNGAQLLLVGRREAALEETRALLPAPSRGVVLTADLTDPAAIAALVERVGGQGRLDLLVNNAGMVASGKLAAADAASRRRMVETNLIAPMALTLALLPLLRAAPSPRIVNVGSMFGDIAFPYFAAYSATKFGLRGWSEALRRELASSGVAVTYAAPRGTRTPAAEGFADLARAFEMALDPPETVARQIVDGIRRGARDIYPRGPERLFLLLQRLVPGLIDGALIKQTAKAIARLPALALLLLLGAAPALAQEPASDAAPDAAAPAKPVAPVKVQLDPDKGWYVSGKGGPSFAQLSGIAATGGGTVNGDHSQNIIGAFGMAAGYEWSYRYHVPLRTELEFMNRTEVTYNASPSMLGGPSGGLASTVQNVTTMAKAYWHFPVGSENWWPFVSGGLGWSHNNVKSQYTPASGSPQSNTHASDDLAWSAGVGATFKLGPQVMNDVEIRYVDLGKADWGLPAARNIAANGIGDFSATEVSFAIRVMF